MASATTAAPVSKAAFWTGWVISILPALVLIMSSAGKFSTSDEISKGFEHLGWRLDLAFALGIIEIVCTIVYLLPPTAVLGAILLTGYLGGAVATHMRVGDPFVPNFLLPILLGVFIWGGLYLRDARVRELVPWRR
jgi:hypothetical protein